MHSDVLSYLLIRCTVIRLHKQFLCALAAEQFQICVAEPDYRFAKHLSDVDCYEKETAIFECQFNYDDAPVTWFKDDQAR